MFGFGGGSGGGGQGNSGNDGKGQGGASKGGFFGSSSSSKKPASPTAAGTSQASSFFGQPSVFGSKSGLAGRGSAAAAGGFGRSSFTSLAQPVPAGGTPAFGSGSGFGGIKKETAAGFGAGSGFGAAPKTSGKSSTGTSSWSTAAAGTVPASSPSASFGSGFGTGGGFGAESHKKTATPSAPSWATVAKTASRTPSTGGFGAGPFAGASFAAAAKTGFGGATGGSFAGGSATDAAKTGFGGATGGSFADAAKRGNLSGGGNNNSGTGGIKPSAGFGTKGGFGSGAGGVPSFAPATRLSGKTSSGRVKARQRESESGDGGDKGAGGSRSSGSTIMGSFGGPPPGITASDPPVFVGGGRLAGASGVSKTKSTLTSSVGSKILGGPPPGITSSDPPAFAGGFGAVRGASKSKSIRGSTSGGSKILGGPPPGISSSSSPPAFVGGGGSGSGGGSSRIMGGFGGPPPGVTSSDPPAFVGGGRTGGGAGGASKSKSSRTSSAGGSKILGGPPPGITSSDPPAFAGGSGATAEDAVAKARRAKRFAGAGGGSGGGNTRSSAGVGDGGGGTAEDVQRGSHLDDAEVKKGIVEAMCPAEEMTRRVPGDLHILEKEHPDLFMPDTGDGGPPRLWSHDDLVVKRHQRAAAGTDISKPELLRTPLWLAHTVDHLVMNCVDKGPQGGGDAAAAWDDPRIQEYISKFRANNPSRADSAEEETEHDLYNFVWDRFRMIRSDYNMQGYNAVVGLVSEACIVAHERMARWYVLMANRMEKNTMQTHRFNLKSIVETLKKLYEFYTIRVARGEVSGGLASPNEPEIMAYYLLTVLEQDGGVEVQRLVKDLVRSRRREVLDSPEIKGALNIVRAWHAGDYVAFFRALRQQGVMHRCLLSQYVKTMRDTAINMIAASFSDFSLSELIRLLCFEDEDQAVSFLYAYSLRVSESGQVHLRMKDQLTGKWKIAFRRPDAIPDPPPLQDLVEPKPWRHASECVCKGDYEPSADKSHDVTAAPPQQQQQADGAKVAAAPRRATSSSSSSGSALTRRRSGSQARLPSTPAQATFPGFAPPASGDGGAPAAGVAAGSTKTVPPFGGSTQVGKAASANKISSGQTPTSASSGASSTPATANGFVFAPHGPAVAAASPGAQKASAGTVSTAAVSQPGFPPLGSSVDPKVSATGGSLTAPAAASGADVFSTQATGAQGGGIGGMRSAHGDSTTAAVASPVTPAPASTLPQTGPTLPAAGTANGDNTNGFTATSVSDGKTASDQFKFTRPAPRDPANKRGRGPSPAEDALAQNASRAAAAAKARREDAERAAEARQRREKAEAEEKRRKEQDAARQRAAAAAVAAAEEAKRVRGAEVRAERALAAGRLVQIDVVDKLPADGRLRRLALDHRKALGLRLAHLEVAVLRRKRSAAWSLWVEETRCWVEEQHLVELRNRRFEEHSALTDHAPFLRRNKKRRSLSFNDTNSGRVEHATTTGLGAATPSPEGASGNAVLRKPQPLNLAAAVTPGVVKNQGANAEEVFRAVGLTTVAGNAWKGREQSTALGGSLPPSSEEDLPFSPPHLFWKAVVVAPSETRGNVGAWLEAKFAAGGSGDADEVPGYQEGLAAHGLCPEQKGGATSLAEDHKETAWGSSGTSKLIYRALRKMPTNARARPGKSGPPSQYMHLCVQRVSVKKGRRLEPSPQLTEKLKSASVLVFAVTPKDHDRFFWSPLHPKPDWSQAREDLRVALDSASPREFLGVPVLVVIPVKESALQRGGGRAETAAFHRIRERILEDAWEGLRLREVAKRGSSFRVALVGLHEFESRSKAAAATAENLVFAGGLEEACSEDIATKLAELAEKAPKQPLVATRCLQELLNTAVSRATTDDRYADALGLLLPASRNEDPPLRAVVGAASRATEHLCRLLARKSGSWPIPEFATTATGAEGGQQREVIYVPGAARAAGGEIARSPLVPAGGSARLEAFDSAGAPLRRAMRISGGLPLDWATALPSFESPSQPNPGFTREADSVLRSSLLPPFPPKLAEAFSPNVLAGGEGSRPLGPQAAWSRVRELETYLGKGLMPEELQFRLAEALAGGMMMRGPPPPWRTLVRDAIARRVVMARGKDAGSPLVIHFIAAFGQDRLKSARSDVVVPGLLEAEDFRTSEPMATEDGVLTPSRDPGGNKESVEARAMATLKRVAPVIADSRPMKYVAKHRRTSSYSSPSASSEAWSHGGYLYASGNSKGAVFDDDDDRLLSERVEGIVLETERLRTSRERAASVAAADRALDADFLQSFGVSLSGSGVGGGGAPSPSFDRGRLASAPLGFMKKAKIRSTAEEEKKKARQRKAAETLSTAEYKCWEVREEIEGYRRQEEEIRAQIFDGDPLLLLLDRSGGGVDDPVFGVSTP